MLEQMCTLEFMTEEAKFYQDAFFKIIIIFFNLIGHLAK